MAFSQQSPDALMPGMLQFCVETKIKIVLLQREVPSTSRGGQAHAHVPMRLSGRLPQRRADGAWRWSCTVVCTVGWHTGRVARGARAADDDGIGAPRVQRDPHRGRRHGCPTEVGPTLPCLPAPTEVTDASACCALRLYCTRKEAIVANAAFRVCGAAHVPTHRSARLTSSVRHRRFTRALEGANGELLLRTVARRVDVLVRPSRFFLCLAASPCTSLRRSVHARPMACAANRVSHHARAHAQRPGCRTRSVVRRSHSAARATRCSAVAPQHTRFEGPLVLQVSSMAAGRGIKRPTQSTGE